MAAVAMLSGVLLAVTCTLVACSGGSEEEGRIRVTPAQVTGIYKLGSERLELKSDGTYIQDTVSESRPLRHTGQWRVVNNFFSGGEVLLIDAAIASDVGPEGKALPLSYGDLRLLAHNRSGEVALARNEVAEWYYERMP